MYSGHPGRTPWRASAAFGLAAFLAAAGSSAFASTNDVRVATTGDVTQGGSKAPAPSGAPGRLSSDVLAKVLKVEQNFSKIGPRDSRLDMARALNGTDDSFQQWQAHLESDKDTAEAIRSAGMTPKEYLRAYATIVQAGAISRAKTSHNPIPDRIRRQVADADVAFVEAHAAELGPLAASGAASITPNTMEDIYVADDDAAKDTGKDAKEKDKDSPQASAATAGDATSASDQAAAKERANADARKKKTAKKP